jgi:twitching motility protein PilT
MEINSLLALSVKQHSSDLHLSPGMPPILRIQGDLAIIPDSPKFTSQETRTLIYSVMTQRQKDLFEKNLELDFAISVPNISEFRVNVFQEANGVAAVFRIIPSEIPTLEALEMPLIFKELMELSNGLVLVTGATGSGKSTTLAAMINYINTQKALHIITIEDPIEFRHQSQNSLINQREVYRDTHGFSQALRAALREDPDVILVGELRDLETIRLALTAAETGHLVMATLHTSSAAQAVNRIIDVFPEGEKNAIRNRLSESLQAVIYQKLIKKITGGRIAAFEIMIGTPAIRHLIREDKIAQMYSTIQTGKEKGMCTMEQYLQELAAKNIIC